MTRHHAMTKRPRRRNRKELRKREGEGERRRNRPVRRQNQQGDHRCVRRHYGYPGRSVGRHAAGPGTRRGRKQRWIQEKAADGQRGVGEHRPPKNPAGHSAGRR